MQRLIARKRRARTVFARELPQRARGLLGRMQRRVVQELQHMQQQHGRHLVHRLELRVVFTLFFKLANERTKKIRKKRAQAAAVSTNEAVVG